MLRMLSVNKNREREEFPNRLRCLIEYLKCRADLNFEVDFISNNAIAQWYSCKLVRSYFICKVE